MVKSVATRFAALWSLPSETEPEQLDCPSNVAARFKEKKLVDSENGGKTTVYIYSERQIALRNRKKAERLEKLRGRIHKLRAQVQKDLKSEDPEKFLVALAVALIDETYERVGNSASADEGHVGVTGWQKSHVSFGKGQATIKYVGKSGVKQQKSVKSKAVVQALHKAYEGCKENTIFHHEAGKIDASRVNAYLKPFDVSAKDIRGLHANEEMRRNLQAVRSKGVLSDDPKECKTQLKEEFKKALELTAKTVGHEPETLKSQYLVPGLAEQFLKDGTVMGKLHKKSGLMANRVLDRYLKIAGGPQVTINGQKYVLSDVWSMLDKFVDDLGAGGAKIYKPEIEDPSDIVAKYRYLWVYNTDKPFVAMYRYSDGDEKLAGKPSLYMRDLQKVRDRGQLNRVTNSEFRAIERWSRGRQKEVLRDLERTIEENKTNLERQVGDLVQKWFDSEFLPRIRKGWQQIERGSLPHGFEVNERILKYRSEEDQAKMYVANEVLKDFDLKAVDRFVEHEFQGLNFETLDNQFTYWIWHEVRDRFNNKFFGHDSSRISHDGRTRVAKDSSEVLSKSWLMGVRRGWLKAMHPAIATYDDVFRAHKDLDTFVERLRDQVKYVRRGLYTQLSKDAEKLDKLFERLLKAIYDSESKAGYWKEYIDKTALSLQWGEDRTKDALHMLDLYSRDFPEATGTDILRGGRSKAVSLTYLMDSILKILYEDAKRIKQLDVPRESAYKEFSLGNVKVVIDDSNLDARQVLTYVRIFDEAQERIKRKGFGKAWQGSIFVQCEECGGTNPYGVELGVGGHYEIRPDTIVIFSRPGKSIVKLVIHELGHRWWFRHMSRENRLRFEDWISSGLVPVSMYGGKHHQEAFAEAFAWYVLEKPMTPQQVETFKLVAFGRRFSAAQALDVKKYQASFLGYRRRIETLLREGSIDDARKLFVELGQQLAPLVSVLEGVPIQRTDEQRKLKNVKQWLHRLRYPFTGLEGRDVDDEAWIWGTLETMDDALKSLVRIAPRLLGYTQIESSFKHGPFTIINKYGYRPDEYETVLALLDKAAGAVSKTGFGAVLDGVAVSLVGKSSARGTAGRYYESGDALDLNVESRYRFDAVYTLIHELGHRYWSKQLSNSQQEAYEEAYSRSNGVTLRQRQDMFQALQKAGFQPRRAVRFLEDPALGELLQNYFKEYFGQSSSKDLAAAYARGEQWVEKNFVRPSSKYVFVGSPKTVTVTDYAKTNMKEDFAETFTHYVLGKPLPPEVQQRFDLAL